MTSKTSKIPIPIYEGTIIFCQDRKAFEKYFKWLHGFEYSGDTSISAGLTLLGYVYKDCKIYYLVGVFDGRSDTLVHEVTHLGIVIMKRAGINPMDGDGEPACYLIEFLYNSLKNKMFAKPKKEIMEYLDGEL